MQKGSATLAVNLFHSHTGFVPIPEVLPSEQKTSQVANPTYCIQLTPSICIMHTVSSLTDRQIDGRTHIYFIY